MKQSKSKEARIIPLPDTLIASKKRILEIHESLSLVDQLLNQVNNQSDVVITSQNINQENILQKMKRYFLSIFMLLCLFFPELLVANNEDKSQAKSFEDLRTLAESYAHKSLDTCIYYWEMAEELALNLDQEDNYVEAIASLASLNQMSRNFKEAEYYANEGLKIAKDKEKKWAFYNVLGLCAVQYDYVKADSIFEIALKLALVVKDSHNIATTYHNIATIEGTQGNERLAADNYILSLKYRNDPYGTARTCANISGVFLNLKNYKRAEEYTLKAVKICDENNYKLRHGIVGLFYGRILLHHKKYDQANEELEEVINYYATRKDSSGLAHSFRLKAFLNLLLKDYSKANGYIDQSIALQQKNKPHEKCRQWLLKAEILIYQKKYQEASDFLTKVFDATQKHNLPTKKMRAFDLLSRIYDSTGKSTLAFQTYKSFKKLEDSLFRVNQVKEINYLEASFKRNEQENKIALLDAENNLSTIRLSQQRKTIIIGAGFLVVVTLLSFFLYSFFRKIKSQNQIISKALSEKDILLREIHHRVKNNLQLVSSLLGLQGMTTQDQHIKEAINAGKSRVMSMALIHQDLYNKEKLTSVNVKEYLDKLCGELINTYQLSADQVRLETEIDELDLDVETLIPLGLIINELLTNALKYAFPHSQQGTIHIKLFEKNNLLHLEVNDDGIGMSDNVNSDSSFGFRMIRSLLRQLDGEMQSDGTDGTQVQFQFKDYKKVA